MLCKIESGKGVLKASKNEGSSMDINLKIELPLALQTNFSKKTRSILYKKKSKEVLKPSVSHSSENEIRAMGRKGEEDFL